MTTMKKTRYDKLESKMVETAEELIDDFGVDKRDILDILNDQLIGEDYAVKRRKIKKLV